jgi:hypothetical protein
MNSVQCWYCLETFTYDDPKYRDVFCQHCGIMCSIYPPDKPDWTPDNQATTESTESEWLNEEKDANGNL